MKVDLTALFFLSPYNNLLHTLVLTDDNKIIKNLFSTRT